MAEHLARKVQEKNYLFLAERLKTVIPALVSTRNNLRELTPRKTVYFSKAISTGILGGAETLS